MKVTLAASLAAYLPQHSGDGHHSVTLKAETWPEAVRELRSRFDRLGRHLFEDSGRLRSGFLVAVNEQVDHGEDGPRHVRSGDELFVFAQIAGG